jgi:acyl-[acyl-carrier-protein]-phospholipid O-acyltransferase / long-chain-fatty-acid--[acyl-carrier-protein] ligase
MPNPLLALVTGSPGLEWLDLAALAGLFVLYFLLILAWPAFFLRPLGWLVTHTIYRMHVYGRENVPARGPALLVCNHVSRVDWLLIWAACPRRVRFVAWAGHIKKPLLRFILRGTRTILIGAKSGPKQLVQSLREITDSLDRGEVVCVFPEAHLTRTGPMLPFRRGFEHVLKQAKQPVPVVPVYLSQLWGSIFSFRGGRTTWKWPERIPYPVAVSFGSPLPPTITAPEARLKLQELAAETAIKESERSRPVHRHFVRVATRFRQMFRPCWVDTTGAHPRTLSYGKALVGSICLSKWLKKRLGAEQNVGVWLPSSVGSALANVALAFMRRTSVNLNYTGGADAIQSAIRQPGMKQIITSKRFLHSARLQVPEGVELIHLEDALAGISKWARIRTFLAVLLLPGWVIDRLLLGMGRHRLDDIATIIFSSGTTGEPKGVMLSHRNIAANTESLIGRIDLSKHDRLLGVLPFFHSFGYTVTLWAPMQIGAATVYHADPRQAKTVGHLCREHRCTILLATATFMRYYLRCDADDFKTLRLIVCGAERLPPKLAEEFEKEFGILPLEGYGCTELAPAVAVSIPDREICGVKQVGNKIGAVGQPIPGVAVRVVNPETYEPLPPGQKGLLLVKGANVMVGYLNQPEKTRQVIRDGWYATGDVGYIDEDGFITLTGRLARFAKIGGEMVPLEGVEDQLHEALGTNDRLLAVAAVPDTKRGERLVVLHLPNLPVPIRELLKKVAEGGMPNLWVPAERDFHPIEEIPVLGAGKVDLRRLQELALAKAGGG